VNVEDVDVGGAEFFEAGFDAEVKGFSIVASVDDFLGDISPAAFVVVGVLERVIIKTDMSEVMRG
jgi:hypothetical protein